MATTKKPAETASDAIARQAQRRHQQPDLAIGLGTETRLGWFIIVVLVPILIATLRR
jgi:hypothetical protein